MDCIVTIEVLYFDEDTGEIGLALSDNFGNCSVQSQHVEFFGEE